MSLITQDEEEMLQCGVETAVQAGADFNTQPTKAGDLKGFSGYRTRKILSRKVR